METIKGTTYVRSFDVDTWREDLHTCRWRRFMSMRQMAEYLGVSASTLSRYESGHTMPSVVFFLSTCIMMNTDPQKYLIVDANAGQMELM